MITLTDIDAALASAALLREREVLLGRLTDWQAGAQGAAQSAVGWFWRYSGVVSTALRLEHQPNLVSIYNATMLKYLADPTTRRKDAASVWLLIHYSVGLPKFLEAFEEYIAYKDCVNGTEAQAVDWARLVLQPTPAFDLVTYRTWYAATHNESNNAPVTTTTP